MATKKQGEILQTKVTTGKVRFSYLNVFEAKAAPGSTVAKFSVSLIIKKEDKKTIDAINAAVENAIDQGVKGKWGGKRPPVLKLPLRDGDKERPDDEAYKGCYFINANSTVAPGLVTGKAGALIPITDRNLIYSGCYGQASINLYPFLQQGNRGVAAGLNNLRKLDDGEPLSGRSTPDADFTDDYEDGDDML